MSREISYQVRHVVTLPDNFPELDEPTNVTIEETTNAAVFHEITDRYGDAGVAVTTTSERLDK